MQAGVDGVDGVDGVREEGDDNNDTTNESKKPVESASPYRKQNKVIGYVETGLVAE